MRIEFDTNPFKLMPRLASISQEEAEELARKYFEEALGHLYVDIPIATDGKGNEKCSRFCLRMFLKRKKL